MKKLLMMIVAALCVALSMSALADLPSGYRQLDYVDTDGATWVNTLFEPTCTNAVEIKASVADPTTTQFLYCSRRTTISTADGKYRRYHSLCVINGKARFDYSTYTNLTSELTAGQTYVIAASPEVGEGQEEIAEKNKQWHLNGYIDGAQVLASADRIFWVPANDDKHQYFCLFGSYDAGDGGGGLNDNTTVANFATCRFYYFKVWDTKDRENLLCHIVPVYGIAEGEVGFYDLVAERFLPVHGTAISSGKVVSANYTLTEDEDWSGDNVMLSSGVTVDLAGHNLTIANAWTPTAATNAVSAANADYQDLAYITATGGEVICIDGFKLPGTAKVETKFRPAVVNKAQFLFSSRTASKRKAYCALVNSNKIRFDFNDAQTEGNTELSAECDYTVVFDGTTSTPTWSVNGVAEKEHGAKSNGFEGGSDLCLFERNTTVSDYLFSGRLYYFTVTTNGVTALDLRPVRRLADGATGLYDTIGDTFYISGTQTDFPTLATPKFTNTSETASELRVGQELVPGYTVVDCITSTGSQYIDTGFVPAATDRMELRASLSSLTTSGLFCSRVGYKDRTFTALYTSSFRFDFNTMQETSSYTATVDVPFTVAFDGNARKGYVNDDVHNHAADTNFTPSAHVYLFAMHSNNGDPDSIAQGSIYGFKVTGADGTLKLYMVPVVRSDNVPGLYDRVGRKFYPSSSRTAFTAGSTVGDGKLYVGSDCDLGGAEIAGNVTLEPAVGTISGATLANGVAIDLSGLSSPFSLEDNAILFADNATIGLLLGSRKTHSATPVIAWSVAPENLSSLVFRRIDLGAECTAKKMSDGIYFIPGMILIVY